MDNRYFPPVLMHENTPTNISTELSSKLLRAYANNYNFFITPNQILRNAQETSPTQIEINPHTLKYNGINIIRIRV